MSILLEKCLLKISNKDTLNDSEIKVISSTILEHCVEGISHLEEMRIKLSDKEFFIYSNGYIRNSIPSKIWAALHSNIDNLVNVNKRVELKFHNFLTTDKRLISDYESRYIELSNGFLDKFLYVH